MAVFDNKIEMFMYPQGVEEFINALDKSENEQQKVY